MYIVYVCIFCINHSHFKGSVYCTTQDAQCVTKCCRMSSLQYTATDCNTLQQTATRTQSVHCVAVFRSVFYVAVCCGVEVQQCVAV